MEAPESIGEEAWKVFALALLMILWWITEAVPLAVTAMLPIFFLPFLGISTIEEATSAYANPLIYLFLGGFMIALAMEKWNLHLRIALTIVKMTGTKANQMVLGFMLATALLSMWISNTATTVMMLPIAVSVLALVTRGTNNKEGLDRLALSMMLGIAYAASIGGIATIIGTPPNLVLVGFLQETYGIEISFFNWMLLAVPFSLVLLVITYFILVKVLYPNGLGELMGLSDLIEKEIVGLGKMGKGEKGTLIVFVITACCWMFREILNKALPFELTDPGIAVFAAIVLFLIKSEHGTPVLDWDDTKALPWGILMLFGGGIGLAQAMGKTGIIQIIGDYFSNLPEGNTLFILIGLTTVSLFLTEVMSNVALVTVFVPVVSAVAVGMGTDPTYLSIPVAIAASCAFMLPMATPPNAIVFASGHVKVVQMVRVGIWLNIISIVLITALIHYCLDWII